MTTLDELHAKTGEYSRALRTIGGALDALPIRDFQITYSAPNYIVRVEVQRNETPQDTNLLRRMLQTFERMLQNACSQNSSTSSTTVFELIYTPKQIEKLEQEGQVIELQQTAYRHSLSRALGRIGAYVELEGADLVQIAGKGGCFTVQYATALNPCITEELSTASWYDFLLMALRSGARAGRIDGRVWALGFKSNHRLSSAQRKWRPPLKSSVKG